MFPNWYQILDMASIGISISIESLDLESIIISIGIEFFDPTQYQYRIGIEKIGIEGLWVPFQVWLRNSQEKWICSLGRTFTV